MIYLTYAILLSRIKVLIVDLGPHPCHVLIMRISAGKTNGLKVLYGRVMRHRDANLCAVGALALYFFARFKFGAENLSFNSNESWFTVKLLVDHTMKNNSKSISDQAYGQSIRLACKELELASKHFVHFGRSVGSISAEFAELDSALIKNLGNWNPDTQESVYSAKLPLKAMRVMAGHDEKKGKLS